MSCAHLTAPYYMKKPTVTDQKVMPFCERKDKKDSRRYHSFRDLLKIRFERHLQTAKQKKTTSEVINL